LTILISRTPLHAFIYVSSLARGDKGKSKSQHLEPQHNCIKALGGHVDYNSISKMLYHSPLKSAILLACFITLGDGKVLFLFRRIGKTMRDNRMPYPGSHTSGNLQNCQPCFWHLGTQLSRRPPRSFQDLCNNDGSRHQRLSDGG
jgi:hypothetical protein